jgi:hypothetical protein
MDSGYYAACTALAARTAGIGHDRQQPGQCEHAGYRAEHNMFSAVLATAQNGPGKSSATRSTTMAS